jgi:hypothetical protein
VEIEADWRLCRPFVLFVLGVSHFAASEKGSGCTIGLLPLRMIDRLVNQETLRASSPPSRSPWEKVNHPLLPWKWVQLGRPDIDPQNQKPAMAIPSPGGEG